MRISYMPLLFVLAITLFAEHVDSFYPESELGLSFDNGPGELPILTLKYTKYRAASYESRLDVYTFKNIRFASPPTGGRRFEKPQPPEFTPGSIYNGSYGPSCIQDIPLGLFNVAILDKTPMGRFADDAIGESAGGTSEDCLFLDIRVPGVAVREPLVHKLAVVMYFHGGAYTFGSKNHVNANGFMNQAQGKLIFATSNYRLGAYGWLAGTTVEENATPNLGLYDQRAALQWLHEYIHLLGGDKSQVSAWGESAGAGSIVHHLVAFGGAQDPLFSKAVMISPAFPVLYDRAGQLEETFQTFATAAGCVGGDMACLKAVDEHTLRAANSFMIDSAVHGSTNIGPASDGAWIRQIAGHEFKQGHYWKQLESIIVSHVVDEAALFTSWTVSRDADFERFIDAITPAAAKPSIPNAILAKYPPASARDSPYRTARQRWKAFVRDSTFTCTVRTLIQSYPQRAWAMQYNMRPAFHGSYLFPFFHDPFAPTDTLAGKLLQVFHRLFPFIGNTAELWQRYLVNHAIYGDPNAHSSTLISIPGMVHWPQPSPANDTYRDILDLRNDEVELIEDHQLSANSEAHCDFIDEVNYAVLRLTGNSGPLQSPGLDGELRT